MEYITTKEASAKWGISTTRITILANEGRIEGAQHLGKNWLIPANAPKPPEIKANHSRSAKKKELSKFSFPLFHFRPDYSYIKDNCISEQHRDLLTAETAALECRFTDAYPILESILHKPDDIITEIGCLFYAGICCIALDKPDDFSRIFLRLQMILSEDFPHHDDLAIILDALKSYVETMDFATKKYICNTKVHNQCLALVSLQVGYTELAKEFAKPGTANTTLLELNLRFLENTSSIVAQEMMHCYLLGIYLLHDDMVSAKEHAEVIVKLAHDNKIYFPLVTYYSYFSSVLDPILAQYSEEFQNHCHNLILQYDKNFTSFLSSTNESAKMLKLSDEDYTYIYEIMTGYSNSKIADKHGISLQTVNRKIDNLSFRLGVHGKKELKEYLRNHM